MNQSNTRECTLCYTHARNEYGVQLYKNNARVLSRILSIAKSDWLQHARSVCGVYELILSHFENAHDVIVYLFILLYLHTHFLVN